jgi:uncharacterized membrane protein HdeD (DUF308 family)
MKKLFDLRFVIGVFFLIVGLLLLIYHFTGTVNSDMSSSVNLWSGIIYTLFGLFMIVISYTSKVSKDKE